jgi:alpha-glucosidase
MLLTLRGTPFLFQGEELGLRDAEIPLERRVDPGGRDGCRAPIPWIAEPTGGWGPSAWLPLPPGAAALSAETQLHDDGSMLNHYRRLLALRRELPVLRSGDLRLLDAPAGVLRFSRSLPGDRVGSTPKQLEIAINFTGRTVAAAHEPGRWVAGTAWPPPSQGHAGGSLAPDEACVVST